jgi:hypothetical protein
MTHLPLDTMTVEEKLLAMELLWNDLCQRAEGLASPSWHEDVLVERESSVARGNDTFDDWETAKRMIRKQTR